jgi:hypothetical protein
MVLGLALYFGYGRRRSVLRGEPALFPALSSDAAQGVTLDQQYIQNLPANGRNAESLILMTPGVTTAAGGKGGGGFNANGLRSNTNYFTLDGVLENFCSDDGVCNASEANEWPNGTAPCDPLL